MVAEVDECCTPPRSRPPAASKPPPRTPMASRLQSPPFTLGSNDDELERAQARAAARAATRRVIAAPTDNPSAGAAPGDMLDHSQIMDLFHNCIKLASENKINQKNMWELSLIDHLSEIIRARPEDDDETNFQKASCTLEAGVKIYSLRVDSVHSEAYKVLGGINRAGRGEEEKEAAEEGNHANSARAEGHSKKDLERKVSPLSTLESSFEALNVKKFDVAFTVDPLYHQTSAQFDEGGAKGLLLNNLGVYGCCQVLFDSFEVPERIMLLETEKDKSQLIDLSFVKDQIEKMMIYMPAMNDISPTLREIVNRFDEDNQRPSDANFSVQMPTVQDDLFEDNDVELHDNAFADDYRACKIDHNDQISVTDDICTSTIQSSTSHQEECFNYMFDGPDMNKKFEKITDFLSLGLGFASKSNAWAGPDHWKYQKTRGLEQASDSVTDSQLTNKKPKNRKGVTDLDFTKSLENEIPDIFMPPKNPKSLLLSVDKVACKITLPEDCNYRPDNLVKLFLLPNVICLGKKGGKFSDEPSQDNDGFVPLESWDNGSLVNDHFEDGNSSSDVEDPGSLIRQPRQVSKVEIQYDKVSKQVDVHALKDMLWDRLQESIHCSDEGCEARVSLKQVLQHFPNDCPAASAGDISPHLFFICLLHLANEHCLSLHDRPGLDELDICIPSSALAK